MMDNYFRNLFRQMAEVFSGPKPIREEITDVIMVFNILGYKLAGQNPNLANIAQIVKIALPK